MGALENFLKFLFLKRLCAKAALNGQRVINLQFLVRGYDRKNLVHWNMLWSIFLLFLWIKIINISPITIIKTKNPSSPYTPIPINLYVIR